MLCTTIFPIFSQVQAANIGDKVEIVEKGFNTKLENNRAFLEGVVSRKKQLLPNIDKNI